MQLTLESRFAHLETYSNAEYKLGQGGGTCILMQPYHLFKIYSNN